MSQAPQTPRFLVVVRAERAVAQTIEYALREARDLHAEYDEPVDVDIRVLSTGGSIEPRTRGRIEKTISTVDSSDEIHTSVESLPLAVTESRNGTDALLDRFGTHEISRLVVSADAGLSVERLRERFGVTVVELAPGTTAQGRRPLLHPGGIRRLGTIFGLTYLFYLAIGGFAGGLDIVTGAISASVVALALSHVALSEEPELRRTGGRLARMVVVLPVLVWEIVKANFAIAYIILHPRLPIDPSMEVVDTDTRDGLERMVLANSITLTPGTVTVDVRGRAFTIHSLTARARSDLSKGRLQGLVSWVFHGSGRPGTRTDERGDEQ